MKYSKRCKNLKKVYGDRFSLKDCGNYYLLEGEADTWDEKVDAGFVCSKKYDVMHIVNKIHVKGIEEQVPICPPIKDDSLEGASPDVLIIGGGVIGCSIARELSRYNLDVMLLEKEYDVATHASSRNDGMVHPGIDLKPGSLKYRLNKLGNLMFHKLCEELEVPCNRVGQYLLFKDESLLPLAKIYVPVLKKRVAGNVFLLNKKELEKEELSFDREIAFALYFDGTMITSPYGLTIALAENAIDNGVKVSLDTCVTGMKVEDGNILEVSTNRGKVYPKLVINAAGTFSDYIAAMAGDEFFSIHPRKGTMALLDTTAGKHLKSIYSIMGFGSKKGLKKTNTKGGGLVPTVCTTGLMGPDAIEQPYKEDFDTHVSSISQVADKYQFMGERAKKSEIITYFAGVRASTYEEDFIVEKGRSTHNIIHAAGIQSPGLTSAPAIGRIVARLAAKEFPNVKPNARFNPHRKAIPKLKAMPLEERNRLIKENPDYGKIVCRCEEISKGEVLDAMRRSLPADTIDAIKRRVRPGMGRCQGGFCGPLVTQIIAEEKGIALSDVRKGYRGSEILLHSKEEGDSNDK